MQLKQEHAYDGRMVKDPERFQERPTMIHDEQRPEQPETRDIDMQTSELTEHNKVIPDNTEDNITKLRPTIEVT